MGSALLVGGYCVVVSAAVALISELAGLPGQIMIALAMAAALIGMWVFGWPRVPGGNVSQGYSRDDMDWPAPEVSECDWTLIESFQPVALLEAPAGNDGGSR